MSTAHTGNVEPSIDLEEHRSVGGVNTKAVSAYNWNGTTPVPAPSPFVPNAFDYVAIATGSNNDVYTFYQGGSGGTLVNTVTITYTDTTKQTISNVART